MSLLLAQLAFLLSAPLVGWLLGLLRAAEAGAAPTGRCPGCFLDYQHRLNRSRLFRSHATR